MSWLLIDTHAPGILRVGWLGPKPSVKIYEGRSHQLLEKLGSLNALKQKTTGVCVVKGPGSFSAVRIGVLVANLLARVLRVPLVGVSVEEASDDLSLAHELETKSHQPSNMVAPLYDAEPNITLPRP